jgi:hypothetical protein
MQPGATGYYSDSVQGSGGTLYVQGGSLQTGDGIAISITGYGRAELRGGIVTSTNSKLTEGTAFFASTGNNNRRILVTDNGLITNTAAGGTAIQNASQGEVTISGGEVKAEGANGRAIYSFHPGGKVVINGTGFVSSYSGVAVEMNSIALMTVTDNAHITSGNPSPSAATVYLRNIETSTDRRLLIQGGIIENTAANGVALYNAGTGRVDIEEGTIRETGAGGYAIRNNSSGVISMPAGGAPIDVVVEAANDRGIAIYNHSTGIVAFLRGTARSPANSYALYNNGEKIGGDISFSISNTIIAGGTFAARGVP